MFNHVIAVAFLIAVLFSSCADNSAGNHPDITRTPLAMESPADSASVEPYLFTDNKGMVYISWIAKEGENHQLIYSSLNNEKWSVPVVIASGNDWFVNWADYPVIATDGGNNLIAHFLQKSDKATYAYDVKCITSNDQGKTWSQPMILHDDGKKAEHGFVSIVPYGEHYFASWLDGRNAAMEGGGDHHGGHHGQMGIRAAIIDKSGKKINEWELDTRVCDCCQTSAAVTPDGPVVVYRDRSDTEIRDISIVRFVNGQWTEPKAIFADNWKIDGCPVNGPRIVAMDNNVAIAWFTLTNGNAQVNVAFSKDGGATFSAPVKVNDGKTIGRVDIEWLDEKTAMACWMEGSFIKAAKVYANGKKDSSFVVVPTSESRGSGFPQMAKAGNKIIFAWTDDKNKTIRLASLYITLQ